ncbi:MAG: GTPase domain-containing protein [Thermodesulfobacteriota bacterium]|nr:GTPase domain-containing protein [Thermodesulfobacteriota bacterium]
MSDGPRSLDPACLDSLSNMLNQALAYLNRPGLILVSPDRAGELAARAKGLVREIKAADDRVCIGLVGGTGVGKSTLINALAGREISPSSELRPTTDRLVLFRHRDNTFSLTDDQEVRVHDAAALERISLADFPDFDSIEQGHRETLARLFPRLDLLLWVVDPNKYADQALFNWLALAPQAKVNCVFVFNKIDEYEGRYGRESASVLKEVVADFEAKLTELAGLSQPLILPLSARSAFESKDDRPQPGFAALTGLIDELKQKKRRLSIKELNLAARTRSLLTGIKAVAAPDRAGAGLERLKKTLAHDREEAAGHARSESQRLLTILGRPWRAGLAAGARDHVPWPLNFFLFIWDRLAGLFPRRQGPVEDTQALTRPEMSGLTRRLTAWRGEMLAAFGPEKSGPGRALAALLNGTPSPEETAKSAVEALISQGFQAAQTLTRRYGWRVRHHLLPLFVLAYPFLPLAAAWLYPQESRPAVQLSVSWSDILPLLETVLGLYLVETIYYAFSLDRAAGRALSGLAEKWQTSLTDIVRKDLITPVEGFASSMEAEIKAVEDLT